MKTSAQSAKATEEKRHKKNMIQHIRFYMNNFELKISFKLCFCLGFANIYSQTNYYLYLHFTVQCIHYNMYHMYKSSVNQKQAKEQEGVGNPEDQEVPETSGTTGVVQDRKRSTRCL